MAKRRAKNTKTKGAKTGKARRGAASKQGGQIVEAKPSVAQHSGPGGDKLILVDDINLNVQEADVQVVQVLPDCPPAPAEDENTMTVYGHRARYEIVSDNGVWKWFFKMESGPQPDQFGDACGETNSQSYPVEDLVAPPVWKGICEDVSGDVRERLKWAVTVRL